MSPPAALSRVRLPIPGAARAKRAGERALLRFVNGLDYFLGERPGVVEPEPYDVVFSREKLILRSYPPREPEAMELGTETLRTGDRPLGLPVLFIPPLMIRPLVYDLREGHSFVGTLRAAGLHPYLVDFGNPDAAQSTVRLDDYVLDWIPAVVEAMRRDCGHSEFAILGYCMGGLFAFMTAAVQPQWGQDLRGIVSIGAPIDSAKMGMLSFLSRTAHGQLDLLASKIGNIPGQLSSAAFKMMMPWRTVTQKADLFLNLWDDEWVRGHESLEAWVGGFLDYPADAFRQFFHDFMKDNQLVAGTMRFGEHTADLRNVRCPVLAFGGTDDKVVPVAAARAALGALGSPDVRFREVPGGHMGVVAGLRAKNTVWAPSRDFLLEIAART